MTIDNLMSLKYKSKEDKIKFVKIVLSDEKRIRKKLYLAIIALNNMIENINLEIDFACINEDEESKNIKLTIFNKRLELLKQKYEEQNKEVNLIRQYLKILNDEIKENKQEGSMKKNKKESKIEIYDDGLVKVNDITYKRRKENDWVLLIPNNNIPYTTTDNETKKLEAIYQKYINI